MQVEDATVLGHRSSSEVLFVGDDVRHVRLALRRRDRAIGVLLQLADKETLVDHVDGHLTLARLLVRSGQLLLELGDPLGLLANLHPDQLALLVLPLDVGLLAATLRPCLEQVGATALLSCMTRSKEGKHATCVQN